jgi:hypothetical protein
MICTEDVARQVIASRKHKYDPDYKTMAERAQMFGTTVAIVDNLDRGKTWKHLPRPIMKKFAKPEKVWDNKAFTSAFEKVKSKCKYASTPNPFVGSPCLEWHGTLYKGRPVMRIFGKIQAAYVFACEFREGRVHTKNEMVLHKCGNKICCEPEHLRFGKAQENSLDTMKHGRCHLAKLRPDDVIQIRSMHDEQKLSTAAIATKFNVSRECISNIIRWESWKYIE